MTKFKEFLRRHSFLLIIFIAIIVAATCYLVYPTLITRQLKLVDVPVANQTIEQNTQITNEMISTIQINKDFLPEGIVYDKETIVGMYVDNGYTIPKNGFVYKEQLCDVAYLYGKTFARLSEGEYAFPFELEKEYVYLSADGILKPGEYINIYLQREYTDDEDNEKHIVGLLAEHIKVINVSSSDTSKITLAVTEEQISDLLVGLAVTDKDDAELVPMLNYQSASAEFVKSTFFDIEQTRKYISSFVDLQNLVTEIEETEEQEEPDVYYQPEVVEEAPTGDVQE